LFIYMHCYDRSKIARHMDPTLMKYLELHQKGKLCP
jgi:hypothetical protein